MPKLKPERPKLKIINVSLENWQKLFNIRTKKNLTSVDDVITILLNKYNEGM